MAGEVFSRKIRLIEGIAKCRHLKKFTGKGTLLKVFICIRLRTPYHPPPPSLPHCMRVYSILIHQGRGVGEERVEPERRGEGQKFTKLGRKYQHD
jgi:hypothetical protein